MKGSDDTMGLPSSWLGRVQCGNHLSFNASLFLVLLRHPPQGKRKGIHTIQTFMSHEKLNSAIMFTYLLNLARRGSRHAEAPVARDTSALQFSVKHSTV
jgi:hypothetical protein